MKTYKKILLLLLGILIITGTTYAWKAGGGVKWIGESTESQKDNRFEDHSDNTSDYSTGYYLDTYTNLKWQANEIEGLARAKDCGTRSDDDNYCGKYLDPIWTGTEYDYTDKTPVDCDECSEDDFQAHKYCESLGEGWRLPTRKEFLSIMLDIKPEGSDYYTVLPNVKSDYWSSTTMTYYLHYAWETHFRAGRMIFNDTGKYEEYYNNTKCIHD